MKKLLTLVILLLVAVLMVLTRPSVDDHKGAMLEVIREYVVEETQAQTGIGVFAKVGQNVIVQTVKVVLDMQLKEHNYYFFNTTSINLDGKDQLLSVGMFGHVFTFDKKMLREKLEPVLHKKARSKEDQE